MGQNVQIPGKAVRLETKGKQTCAQ